jgi:CheY-like chemotaxis protein
MPKSLTGTKVVVVEDRRDVQAIAQAILTRLGCQVSVVATARDALAAIDDAEGRAEARFDVVFTDIQLPGGMSGLDLAATLRQRWPGIKTILTSGVAGPVDMRGLARAEGYPVLAKPYRPQQLAEAIRGLIQEPA